MSEGEASVVVEDRPDRGRFEITVNGELAGFSNYHRAGGALDFTHTQIDDAYEGQGLGSVLIRAALDTARERGADVLPHCPFVKGFIQRHHEYLDLVPITRRRQFGLPE
ncbi:MAG: acetyltransferase [Mycobacterium sp.]|nr:acetyltransferase [Mycobacterium sp.]